MNSSRAKIKKGLCPFKMWPCRSPKMDRSVLIGGNGWTLFILHAGPALLASPRWLAEIPVRFWFRHVPGPMACKSSSCARKPVTVESSLSLNWKVFRRYTKSLRHEMGKYLPLCAILRHRWWLRKARTVLGREKIIVYVSDSLYRKWALW